MGKKTLTNGSTNRRTVLRGIGAGAAGLGLGVSTASAAQSEEKTRKRDRRKFEWALDRREPGEVAAFHDDLRKTGADVRASHWGYKLSEDGKGVSSIEEVSDGVSKTKYNKYDLTVSVSIAKYQYESFADMDWTVETGWWEAGSYPYDHLTLGWSDSHYVYDGEYNSGTLGTHLWNRGAQGALWRFDDQDINYNETHSGYVTAILDRQSTCDTRHVYGTFEHSWSSVEVTGYNLGTGGVSIYYSDETYVWRVFPEAERKVYC